MGAIANDTHISVAQCTFYMYYWPKIQIDGYIIVTFHCTYSTDVLYVWRVYISVTLTIVGGSVVLSTLHIGATCSPGGTIWGLDWVIRHRLWARCINLSEAI